MPAAFPRTLKAPRGAPPPRRPTDDRTLVRAVERVWAPLFRRAGERYEPAQVAHFGDEGAKPCASPEENLLGLYCGDDHRIFLVKDGIGLEWLYVVAHEVGHHVQELRGTLDAAEEAFTDRPVDGSDLHLREELQADCYAGVWAHAAGVPPPDPSFFDLPEEEPGTPSQRRRWLMRGRRTGRPAACDTFSVARP